MHLKRFVAIATVMVALAAPSVTADTIALTSFTGGLNATSGSDQIYGWEFSLSSSVNVTALGVYDYAGTSGLSISHNVGIFDATSQALLTSATVPAGTAGTLIDGFMYVSLASPYTLAAGEYVIGMSMPQGNTDYQYIEVSSETTSSPVTYVNSAFGETSGSTLVFPSDIGAFAPGMFGPNFQFASVPEPSSLVLGIIPVAVALGAVLRRRRSTN